MANTEKKYASLETLTSYDGLIKTYITTEIDEAVSTKSNSDHTHVISDVTNLQTELDAINNSLEQKSQVQIVESDTAEVLSTLKIHKLTQEEYDQAVASGTIDETALYLTPEEEVDLSGYVTIEQLNEKSDITHTHDIADVNELQSTLDTLSQDISAKSDTGHTHEISDITNLQTSLDEKVPTSRTINGKTLNEDIILSATDIGADVSGSADTALSESKTYTDNAVAQKSQVQIITWEVDD